jgi:sulfite dehydrogenase (quinone) subunit SoeB
MTDLPKCTGKKLGLVIDLDICVGCHACAVNCKEWNTAGKSAPLTDYDPYGKKPDGVWFNRVHTYETTDEAGQGQTVHFPRSCLHCEDAPCVTVCPTGASYKRTEDGIVLVNEDICIGCKLCSWACPYGAREYDEQEGVMKKCTLCIDKIYNETLPEESRVPACVSTCPSGARSFGDLGDPEVNKYLPPRPRQRGEEEPGGDKAPRMLSHADDSRDSAGLIARWVDKMLS